MHATNSYSLEHHGINNYIHVYDLFSTTKQVRTHAQLYRPIAAQFRSISVEHACVREGCVVAPLLRIHKLDAVLLLLNRVFVVMADGSSYLLIFRYFMGAHRTILSGMKAKLLPL